MLNHKYNEEVKRYYDSSQLLSLFPLPIFKALDRNHLALISEGKMMKSGLFAYYVHYARKPR